MFGSLVAGRGAGSGDRCVERERENLDLVMHWPDRGSLVIENKVFPSPTPSNLIGMPARCPSGSCMGGAFLLSPTRHAFLERVTPHGSNSRRLSDRLQHLSFETLRRTLELAFDAVPDSYEVETARRYCTVLRHCLR